MKTKNIIYSILMSALMLLPASLGAQTSSPVTPPDGVFMSKSVSYLGPNRYQIDLEAYVTGDAEIKITGSPLDVVLVLDFSGSMNDGDKWTNMKSSVSTFLGQLVNYSTTYEADVKVGVVSFSDSMTLITDCLINVVNDSDDFTALKEKFSYGNTTLKAKGSTRIDLGMQQAENWLKAEEVQNDGAAKFVIAFTDGRPEGEFTGFDGNNNLKVAQNAIGYAKNIKNEYNATIYSIGLFNENDETKLVSTLTETGGMSVSFGSWYGQKTKHPGESSYMHQHDGYDPEESDDFLTARTFMQRLSSFYPKADIKSVSPAANPFGEGDGWDKFEFGANWFTPKDESDAFYQCATTSDLSDIFANIFESISGGASYPLTEEAKVIDVVSDSFRLPVGASASNITVKAADCTGTEPSYTFGTPHSVSGVSVDVDGKTIQITGFDFSENYVGKENGNPHGSKLIISFPIEMDPAGPGGAHVPTNTADSGISLQDNMIGSFEIPYVSIPNIVIKKEGLHQGESATFNVYKIVEGERSGSPMVLVATQTSVNPGDACVVKARVQPGTYEVVEEGWSWAYTTDGSNSITKEVNETTENHDDPACPGTFFNFSNTLKEGIPAHAEASKNNIFYESR